MTQEEKQLLLKDLCARLPYGIKCTTKLTGYNDVYVVQGVYEDNVFIDCPVYEEGDDEWMIESIIPFLRPMSIMTKEEMEELKKLPNGVTWSKDVLNGIVLGVWYNTDSIDWLNKKMFDYRGLIPMGLGIDCTGLNIYENEKSI